MDTKGQQLKEMVDQQIAQIKAQHPGIMKLIQDKAENTQTGIGNRAYALARRGLAGEPNCFAAWDGKRFFGTPFSVPGMMQDAMALMAAHGVPLGAIWADVKGQGDGAH